MVVWGKKDKWTADAIERAKQEYRKCNRPWFCQICGGRVCECGSPLALPSGSNVLNDNGCLSHISILGVDAGCINPTCGRYKVKENVTVTEK